MTGNGTGSACIEPALSGGLEQYLRFPSRLAAPRNVDVWLPSVYQQAGRRFPVLYVHDGQNLFDAKTSYAGVTWGIAEAMERLVAEGRVGGSIIVGIWNTPLRHQEYLPQIPVESSRWASGRARKLYGGPPLSDGYLRFLVEELKPFVDGHYRTMPEPEGTFVMGSSMGGLISAYALCRYPHVFTGAACLSTHWPAGRKWMIAYLREALPAPGAHRIYFDLGTEALDASYATYQHQVDRVMREAGYREGQDWMTQVFAGAEHSERAWRERIHIPLEFLLAPRDG